MEGRRGGLVERKQRRMQGRENGNKERKGEMEGKEEWKGRS